MHHLRVFGQAAAILAVLTWISPAPYLQAGNRGAANNDWQGVNPTNQQPQSSTFSQSTPAPATPTPVARDIALQPGGVLWGQLVDEQGAPAARQFVLLQHGGRTVKQTASDQDGRFAISGLRGGTYLVATTNSAAVCRLWAPQTAPPSAAPGVLLTTGDSIFRGQNPSRKLFKLLLLGAAIGAAIAIPVALANRKDERVTGS